MRVQAPRVFVQWLSSQGGFTLVELLFAVAVIMVGLVALVAGFTHAVGGIETGKQQTTATFLAEQRLEQIKGTTFANVTAANFPAEAYNSIASAPGYRRATAITDNPGGNAGTKLVEVTVLYRPVAGFAVFQAERQVRLSTLLVDR